jgi:acyl-coenzyme A synthetase/AMP-(fatty) acid ligase
LRRKAARFRLNLVVDPQGAGLHPSSERGFSRSLASPIAVVAEGSFSYGDFLCSIERCARQLPDAPQFINLCESRLSFAIAFFAVVLRGQCNILLPGSTAVLQQAARDSFPHAVVLRDADIQVLPESSDDIQAESVLALLSQVPAAQDAALVFSSGTTGLAKQITKSWGSLYKGAKVNARCLARYLYEPASMVATVPHWHMYGLEWTVLLPLIAQLKVSGSSAPFPEDIRAALEAVAGPRVLLSTPLHLRAFLDSGLSLPPLELVISATAPLSSAMARRIEATWGARCLELYGCSELGSMASRSPGSDEHWRFFPEFAATTDGSSVTLQAEHTGDPVRLADQLDVLPDGSFTILGRDQDMVKVAGKRGSLAEINAAVMSMDGVIDCVVYDPANVGLPDSGRLAALLVSDTLSISEFRKLLKDYIDPAFLPRPVHRVDHIPRDATGKLQQADLGILVNGLARVKQNGG